MSTIIRISGLCTIVGKNRAIMHKFRAISTTADTPMSSRFVADNNVFSGESISVGYESQGKWLKSVGASSLTVRAYMNDNFPDFNREK